MDVRWVIGLSAAIYLIKRLFCFKKGSRGGHYVPAALISRPEMGSVLVVFHGILDDVLCLRCARIGRAPNPDHHPPIPVGPHAFGIQRTTCSKCNIASYCNSRCRKADKPAHKKECQSWAPMVCKNILRAEDELTRGQFHAHRRTAAQT
ncbi:hypothetical protein BD626DRAFT_507579 [Schizophyllum amplum]|uniref:MYND-type domain-containing protein n=1 Tax=Schizophyllum amplum TaxID=97359 RepID=A0A550C441_9AGAR|nr:hypothetical protein BD626DRAFT_507579 [Auriculariopsis ampla]